MSNILKSNESPKQPRRRRSTSLDSKVIIKYRENNICQNKIPEKQMKKYASSSSLFNPENLEFEKITNSPRLKHKSNLDCNCYFLFVNWLKDFKSVKPLLLSLHDPNIFKTEFPRHNDLNLKEFYPPLLFFVINNLKIDNEYEAYLINDYDIRLKELLEWSESGTETHDEYSHGLELIDKQVADFEQLAAKEDNEKQFGDKTSNQRRHSETMALIIQNKNQPMQTFLPREHQGLLNVIRFTCEFEMIYVSQDKKLEKNYKPFPRVGVLSNIDINIYTRNNMKLKDSYVLRHLYLGQCNDTQIANIDSCLRIGGPFGNDMIIRFPNPQTRNEWNKYINEQINAYQESIKNNTTTIIIFNDTNPPSSVPLVSKTITINGNTLGLGLKKIAMGLFEIKDVDINDLSIIFLVKNKENLLHDDVSLMVLQEHVNNIQENNCAKSCMECDKLTAIVKIIYYLRSNKPLADNFTKDGSKKKIINTRSKEEIKIKQNKYNISSRWVDNEIPNWLMNLLSDLYNEGAKCEGIFRISGAVVQSDDYINQICETDDVKIEASINTKASILKKFISIIDGSLLTSINKDQFMILSNEINSVEEFLVQEEQQSRLLGLIQKIPLNNFHLFQHILVVLSHIIENSQGNQMNITNLATCFSQNLFKHLSDDAVKINKVFECILHLITRIVNAPTYHNIVMAYETKQVPTGSGEIHYKSDALVGVDRDSNSPRTASDSAEESHSFLMDNSKPLVPPRRKRGILRSNTKYTPSTITDPAMRKVNANKNEKRQSLCEEMIGNESPTNTDFASKMLHTVDSSYLKKINVINKELSKEKKLSRGRSTLNNNLVLENQSTNFQRQTQVSRKHLKNNTNSDNSSLNQSSANNSVNQIKSVSKLSRNTDRVIPKMRSRSQTKFGEHSSAKSSHVSRQPSSVTSRINTDSSLELNNSRDSKERKRSSSACRVPQLKEQYEANQLTPKPPLPLKKSSLHSESQLVSKIIKDFEENKIFRPKDIRTNRSRNLNGPIRPYHNFPNVNAQNELPQESSPSFYGNVMSLQDQLNDSNDENVTYI